MGWIQGKEELKIFKMIINWNNKVDEAKRYES